MPGSAASGFSDARKALLKALEALQTVGLQNFVLVGAQAVYLRTTRVVPQMPPFTTDADLVVDPRRIVKRRDIYDALEDKGFGLRGEHFYAGMYDAVASGGNAADSKVDILVPAAFENSWNQETYSPRDKYATMTQEGLELTLTDHSEMEISSGDDAADGRAFRVNVAGSTSLLIAKGWKIGERFEQGPESFDKVAKDIGDIYLLLTTDEDHVWKEAVSRIPDDAAVKRVVAKGAAYLERLCCVNGPAVSLLREHLGRSREADIVLASIPELMAEFCTIVKAAT